MTYYPRILNRALSQALTASRQQRSMSYSLKAVPDAANVEDLRALAGPTFAKPDFRDIQWAGVFGSFASGTQTPESDVDVVVYQKALTEELSPDRLYLEDVLHRVWNRRVDIIRVEDHEFRGYVSIESLLCSQTVYGSARDEEVLRLRRRASKALDSGREHHVGTLKETEQVKSMIEGIPEEGFLASPELQQSILPHISTVLDGILHSQYRGHPMRDAFFYILLEPAREIKSRLESIHGEPVDGVGPNYWKTVWDVASQNAAGSLGHLARRINDLVFPLLDETREQSKVIQQLHPSEAYED